ncbi:uncharacterized protein [Pyrus communis]|uniref:uncharacterized protein n=1 Tax=Pyrus communis TaxID=23211 RepID=UPI0035C0235E
MLGRLSATIAPSHVPQEFKDTIFHELSRHYELSNFNANQLQYINDLCSSRFTQWKSDLHKHYELYDGPEVALEVGCPIELVDRRDEWEWLYDHFQDEKYLKKVKANSINRLKKKLLH